MNTQDTWSLGGKEFSSRFILGSGKYSLELIEAAVRDAGAQMNTLAVRRWGWAAGSRPLECNPKCFPAPWCGPGAPPG